MPRYRSLRHRRKGKLLLAGLLTTSLAFASSVTATFAWFNLDAQQKDQILNFGVSEPVDAILEMGYYDVNGNAVFPTEEDPFVFDEAGLRKAFGPAGYDPSKPLDPVTGLSSVIEDGKPQLTSSYRSGLDPKTFLYEDGSRPEDVGTYYQFEFAFRCNMDCWVYLAPDSHVSPGDNVGKFDGETGLELDEDKLNEAVHSLRVRFTGEENGKPIDYVTVPTVLPSKEGQDLGRADGKAINDVYYGGVACLTADSGYYDALNGEEVVYGQLNDTKLFSGYGDGIPFVGGDFLHAGHAKDVHVVDVDAMKSGGMIAKENAKPFSSIILEEGVGQSSSYLLSLKANKSQRLVVTVYLEGWDPYCTNDIGQAAMSLDLVFTGLVH